MKLCDGNIKRYIRNQYYALLDPLPPVKRFVKKFELLLDSLKLEIRDYYESFGWLTFCNKKQPLTNTLNEQVMSGAFFLTKTNLYYSYTYEVLAI